MIDAMSMEIEPANIVNVLPRLEPLLFPSLDEGIATAIRDALIRGEATAWIAWDGVEIEAAAAVSYHDTALGTVCTITPCTGQYLNRWNSLFAEIEETAKQRGCDFICLLAAADLLQKSA